MGCVGQTAEDGRPSKIKCYVVPADAATKTGHRQSGGSTQSRRRSGDENHFAEPQHVVSKHSSRLRKLP